MWMIWDQYLKPSDIQSKFFGTFEDDCIIKKDYILDIVDTELQKDNIFVGSLHTKNPEILTVGHKSYNKSEWFSNRIVPWVYGIHPKHYKWCEDPYIMYFENLSKIEKTIGIFTLAPLNEKYDKGDHGINYGEVGFPTRLNIAGFKFTGLTLSEHFEIISDQSNSALKMDSRYRKKYMAKNR